MVRMPAGHLPSPPMEAARLFPEPAAGEPYTILIMLVMLIAGKYRSVILLEVFFSLVHHYSLHGVNYSTIMVFIFNVFSDQRVFGYP
jgi:hypothetical protein